MVTLMGRLLTMSTSREPAEILEENCRAMDGSNAPKWPMDDAAEVDKGSHGTVDEKVHTPSVEEADDKKKDAKTVEEESPNILKVEAKPEEKVLIRTERVTIPEKEPADKPTLHIIQASTKEGNSKIM